MKINKLMTLILMSIAFQVSAQQKVSEKEIIKNLVKEYSRCVIEKDSTAFYGLFNDGTVTWCAALKDRSQAKEAEKKGVEKAGSNYFSGSYKGFMRGLYRFYNTEDKFDNIQIIEDGTVATVSMDYSFWGNGQMSNWGGKYLSLIKRDGKWKITSVIYSLEMAKYYPQPAIAVRIKLSKPTTY